MHHAHGENAVAKDGREKKKSRNSQTYHFIFQKCPKLYIKFWVGGLKVDGRGTANKQKFYGRPFTGLQDLHVYLNFQSTIFVMTSLISKIML